MKRLYPYKKVRISQLNLSRKELEHLKEDKKNIGGFNVSYDLAGNIEELWLSNNGIKFIRDKSKHSINTKSIIETLMWIVKQFK